MFIGCGVLFAQQPEVVLTDFDGAHFEGVTYSIWSYNYPSDTVDNPITDGINASAKCVFYPCHWFYSAWGWVPSFQVFKPVPVDLTNDHTYFYFEILAIQDTLSAADTLVCEIKFKGGATEEFYSAKVEIPLVAGGENVWQAVAIEIPADNLPTDHPQVELMTSPKNSETATYYDNFGFTNTEIGTAIRTRAVRNDISVFMPDNSLHIRMDETSYIRDVQVYNINGARLFQESYNSLEKDFTVPLDLNSGIYVVKITCDKQAFTKKFVKF